MIRLPSTIKTAFNRLTDRFRVPTDICFVGFAEAFGGIGKVFVNIHECLDDSITKSFIQSSPDHKICQDVPRSVVHTCSQHNRGYGRVSLLTDLIWHRNDKPARFIPKMSDVKLAYTMLETTKIPDKWVSILNQELDAAVVPDEYLLELYRNCGVKIPIFVLPIPMQLSNHFATPLHQTKPTAPFIFGDASANKNSALLINAFAQAFGNSPTVCLYLRASKMFPEKLKEIHSLIKKHQLSNVVVESGPISHERFIHRLSSFDCFINLSRGEGYSFIPREALALGIPTIITDNTASSTICKTGYVYSVPSNIKGPANYTYNLAFQDPCGEQFDCTLEDAALAMQEVYGNYDYYCEKAKQGREWVKQFDYHYPRLRALYQTLVKPKKIILGPENTIEPGVITTNSQNLYDRYQKIISGR